MGWPGSVDEHRILREPPLAVARAAHTLHRTLAVLGAFSIITEQKLQAGVHQRRGLARTGRADEHVPGQFVQILPAAAEHATAFGCLQALHRFVEASGQHLRFLVAGRWPGAQALQQRGVGLAALVCLPNLRGNPQTPDQHQDADTHPDRIEGP